MSTPTTRRDFLRISAFGLTAAVAGDLIGKPSHAASSGLTGWSTAGSDRMTKLAPIAWRAASGAAGNEAVAIIGEQKFQTMLGFGGAFTDSSCYTFNEMPAEARAKVLNELFNPSELNLNVCRTCIGSSDYASKAYSFDDSDSPDPKLTKFSIAHDQAYILPVLREAKKVNPDLYLFSSPWSPPGWMKSNKSMLGGNMRREYMGAYADYFVKFLKAYEADGVSIQAVTVQNEVDTDQDGRMPACTWPQEYEADFVRQNLGPAIEAAGLKTQIWVVDHNYNLWGRALGELETPNFTKYCKSIAWHGYVGDPGWMTRVHDAVPNVEMYWTEGGPDYTDPKYPTNWTDWSKAFTGILRNWCRSITAWNLALDEKGKPNIGPFSCGGLVTVNSKTKEVTRSGQYWALAHFSRHIKRGAQRIGSESKAAGLHHIVFENPDKTRVAILTNEGTTARVITLQVGEQVADVPIAADSVVTLTW